MFFRLPVLQTNILDIQSAIWFGICISVFIFLIISLRSKLRFHEGIEVNCWFCNVNATVPYGNQNCWDCPNCDQYNGFNEDGSYNKPIPAQYEEFMNHPVVSQKTEFISCQNTLCQDCRHKCALKVRQVADFAPFSEESFQKEADTYEQKLEQLFDLCDNCKLSVQRELAIQDDILQAKLFSTPNSIPRETKGKSETFRKHYTESFIKQPVDMGKLVFWLTFISFCVFFLLQMLHCDTLGFYCSIFAEQMVPCLGFMAFVGCGSYVLIRFHTNRYL